MTARLVSIIGPPAVGKTTLARELAAALPGELIREEYDRNPFLAESYTCRPEFGLPSQVYFLLTRIGQLAPANLPPEGVAVSDYGYCQDRLYARERLSSEDYAHYERAAWRVDRLVQRPAALIVLTASVGTLLGRIERRGRDFEKAMTPEFLRRMSAAYEAAEITTRPESVLVNCDATDPLAPENFAALTARIRELLATADAHKERSG